MTYFGMEITNEEADIIRFLGFTIELPREYNDNINHYLLVLDKTQFGLYERFTESQEEKYGETDCAMSDVPYSRGILLEAYETPFDKIPELMESWRQFFVQECELGEDAVGAVIEVPWEVYESISHTSERYIGMQDDMILEQLNKDTPVSPWPTDSELMIYTVPIPPTMGGSPVRIGEINLERPQFPHETFPSGKLCLYYTLNSDGDGGYWELGTLFAIHEFWEDNDIIGWIPLPYLPDLFTEKRTIN